ncbi:unnamed protein product [Gadus morhua 'NCC']
MQKRLPVFLAFPARLGGVRRSQLSLCCRVQPTQTQQRERRRRLNAEHPSSHELFQRSEVRTRGVWMSFGCRIDQHPYTSGHLRGTAMRRRLCLGHGRDYD